MKKISFFKKPEKIPRGFTVIEVLISIFILVIGIIGVLQAFPLGVQVTKAGQMTTIAAQLAQAKLEAEFSKSYSDFLIGTSTEDYGTITNFNFYKRVTEVNCIRSSDLTEVPCDYDLTNDPFPMKKVEVTTFWKSPFGFSEKDIKLVSLISKK